MSKKQIELTDFEFELITGNSLIAEDFAEVFEALVHDGENCHLSLTEDELNQLAGYIEAEAVDTEDRRLRRELKKISEYLKSL